MSCAHRGRNFFENRRLQVFSRSVCVVPHDDVMLRGMVCWEVGRWGIFCNELGDYVCFFGSDDRCFEYIALSRNPRTVSTYRSHSTGSCSISSEYFEPTLSGRATGVDLGGITGGTWSSGLPRRAFSIGQFSFPMSMSSRPISSWSLVSEGVPLH